MDKKNDFDFLKDKFDADGLKAPESMSAEEMKKRILSAEPADAAAGEELTGAASAGIKKPHRRYVWGSIGAAAACVVAVVLIGNTVVSPLGNYFAGSAASQYGELAAGGAAGNEAAESGSAGSGNHAGAATEAGTVADVGTLDQATGMISFSDYAELERKVSQMVPEEEEIIDYDTDVYDGGPGLGSFGGSGSTATDGMMTEDVPMAAAEESGDMTKAETGAESAADAGMGEAGYDGASSDTYVQVKGVEEADIVKTDENYIYYLDDYHENIWIAEAKDGKATRIGQVEVLADLPMIDDFYLNGDTLVTIGSEWNDMADRTTTMAVIYDISDRTSPVKVNEYRQSGYLVSSRMVGEELYLITDYSFYYYGNNQYIPYVTGENGYDRMNISDICAFPNQEQPEYVIAGAVDISSGKQLKTRAKAVLGGSQDVYCNTENLFITGYYYDYQPYVYEDGDPYILDDGTEIYDGDVEEDTETGMVDPESDVWAGNDGSWKSGTRILKVALNDGDPQFVGSTLVEGYVNNQFSMDEKDGFLRIATTSTDAHGYDVNNLFVLDENLKQVGAVTGFAKDEHVEAVRYIGEKAYVITYEQTDPLFVIDVSDPTSPKIEGSVKIDGFSTLLVPAGNDTLFGIGHATATTKFGEVQEGLKLVTFDVSDPSIPKVSDAKEFLNADSEVQYNHKALLKNATADYYAIPYNQYDDEDYYFEHGGVLVVRIRDGKIQVLKDYQEMNTEIRRCVFIGDYIYTIDEDDQIGSFLMR